MTTTEPAAIPTAPMTRRLTPVGEPIGSPDRRRSDRRSGPARQLSPMPTVSVVIPTLNEARNLPHVLPLVPEWVDELIIVDGRSTDDTIAVAQELRPDVRIVTDREPGKGRALMTGFHASTGEILVTLDADGSMDPGEIPRYVYALLAGADFVKGSRFIHGGATDDMTGFRKLGNRSLTEIVRRTYGGKFSDLCYGYNACWRDVLPYLEGRAPGFEIETHMNIRALSAGLDVVEVPSFEAERLHGTSNLRTIRDGSRVLRTIVTERRRLATGELPPADRRPARSLTVDGAPSTEATDTTAAAAALTVSAVVCTHDMARWDELVRCVGSLRSQTVVPAEVVVVVDHNPSLLARAQEELDGITVVPSAGPRGLSGARNTAVMVSTGDVVAFIDDDAHAEVDWVERLLAAYRGDDVLAVGGAVLPSWASARPRWMVEEMDWVVGCTYRGLPEVRAGVRNVIGANMSFRRQVLVDVGGFDSGLGRQGDDGAGCEETEVCIRARQLNPGGTVLFEPAARVWHRVPEDRASWSYFVKRCRAEGRSKAGVSERTGADAALASEKAYVAKTLPMAVARSLADTVHRKPHGVARAASVVAGTALVATEYARGRLAQRSERRDTAGTPAQG